MTQLAKLEYLSCDLNQLVTLPVLPPSLSSLFATGNVIATLPTGFFALARASLVRINLDQNRIATMPASEWCLPMPALDELYLQENLMTSIPSCFFASAPKLRNLYMAKCPLFDLPASVAAAPSLKLLDITNCMVSAVVPCSPTLSILFAKGNLLRDSDPGVTCLPAITTLILSDNPRLTSLECARPAVNTLKTLDVSKTAIKALNLISMIGSFAKLFRLSVSDMGLDVPVPRFMAALIGPASKTLGLLDLSHNPKMGGSINEIDFVAFNFDYITFNFPELIDLSLRNCSLVILDEYQYENFPSLRSFNIQDNPTLLDVPYQWNNLITLDARGSAAVAEDPPGGLEPSKEDREVVDEIFHVRCPSAVLVGGFNKFRLLVTPEQLEYRLCVCLPGYFGRPAEDKLPCLPCAADQAVDCSSGTLVTAPSAQGRGKWPVVVAAADSNTTTQSFALLDCPGERGSSPCASVKVPSVGSLLSAQENLTEEGIVTCADGYKGRLCSECADGFFSQGRLCKPCGEKTFYISPLISFLALSVIGLRTLRARWGGAVLFKTSAALGPAAAAYASSSDVQKRSAAAVASSGSSGLLRIVINHFQLYSSLPLTSVAVPNFLAGRLRVFEASTSITVTGTECLSMNYDTYTSPYYFNLAVPAIVFGLSCALSAISALFDYSRGRVRVAPLKAVLEDASTVFMYLWSIAIFKVLQVILGSIACTSYGSPEGTLYVTKYLWIPCSGSRYAAVASVGIIFTVIVSVATLALIVYAGVTDPEKMPGHMRSFAHLVRAPYREGRSWWEAVAVGRKVAFAIFQATVPYGSFFLPFGLCVLLIVSLAIQTYANPYIHRVNNRAEIVSLLTLVCTFLMSFSTSEDLSTSVKVVTVILFVFNAVVVGGCLVLSILGGVWLKKVVRRATIALRSARSQDKGAMNMIPSPRSSFPTAPVITVTSSFGGGDGSGVGVGGGGGGGGLELSLPGETRPV